MFTGTAEYSLKTKPAAADRIKRREVLLAACGEALLESCVDKFFHAFRGKNR